MFLKWPCLSLCVLLCGLSTHLLAQEADNDPRDFAALADPARLTALLVACSKSGSETEGEAPSMPEIIEHAGSRTDCLLELASTEYANNLATPKLDSATFSRRLEEGANTYADTIRTALCNDPIEGYICGSMSPLFFEKAREDYLLLVLDGLWSVYADRAL